MVKVRGRQYFWTVENRTGPTVPEQGFATIPPTTRVLHIISSKKDFIVHYRLPEPGDAAAVLTVEGKLFPREPGATEVLVPRWRHDTRRYPTGDFVRRLIGWCLGLEA